MNRTYLHKILYIGLALLLFAAPKALLAQSDAMRLVPQGSWQPFFKGNDSLIHIDAFYMDSKQVTNKEFKEFVEANPKWNPEAIKPILADEDYLSHWKNLSEADFESIASHAVVNVSWFAANAYCNSKSKRLPTTTEWEYAATALPMGASKDEGQLDALIADWYSRKLDQTKAVGSVYQNKFGLWDMYGMVWEWVSDFDKIKASDDSRNNQSVPEGLFCGSASQDVVDASDYAGFIRFAFRSSLKGNYTVRNLGFRCAANVPAL